MEPDSNILQIIPADGWFAIYNIEGKETRSPLVCWALVEKDSERDIRGMDADGDGDFISDAADAGNFIRFERGTAKPNKEAKPKPADREALQDPIIQVVTGIGRRPGDPLPAASEK